MVLNVYRNLREKREGGEIIYLNYYSCHPE